MADEQIKVEHIVNNTQVIKALDKMISRIEKSEKASAKSGQTSQKAAKAAEGSYEKLTAELKQNEAALKRLTFGTQEFGAQKTKVDKLRAAHAKMKGDISGNTVAMGGFGKMTQSVGMQMVGLASGVGVVTAAVRTLKEAVEAVEQGNETKRLSTIDFEAGLIGGKGNFTDQNDKQRLRVEALRLAGDTGLNPGGVAEVLGDLKSRGASDLDEAVSFLREASGLRPGDIGAASALAGAGLVEARGIGNRDPKQVLGGILSAQVASQTSNPLEFGKAFSANTVSLVQSGGFTEEQAREEAAIFSVLEPKSADVAATSQKAFERAVRKFDKLDGKGTIREKIQVLEKDAELRAEFIDKLPDEGRNAIVRRISPGADDAATFAQIRKDTISGPAAAALFDQQKADVLRDAPNLIANAKRETQGSINEITSSDLSKFEANVKASTLAARKRSADDDVSSYIGDKFGKSFGGLVESATQGFTNTRISQLGNIAATDAQPEDRKFAQEQLVELRKIAEASDLKEQAALLKGILDALERNNQLLVTRDDRPLRVKVEGNGPVEAPPAAGAIP